MCIDILLTEKEHKIIRIAAEESKISSFDMNNCYYINYSSVGHNGKIRGVKCESVRIKAKDGVWQEVDV